MPNKDVDNATGGSGANNASASGDVDNSDGVELFTIPEVEIFSTGTWNGDRYDEADLDEMVSAFDANKEFYKPYLKLGHDDQQTLLQKDGYPAAGYIGSLKREGGKLVASFVEIPKKIFELIKNKAYKKVSAEVFWNSKINGTSYKRSLAAVSLLGANVPAVQNLNDILAFYGISEYTQIKSYRQDADSIKHYEFDNHGEGMPEDKDHEVELKTYQDKLAVAESEIAKSKAEKEASDKEIADLKKFKADAEAKLVEAEKKEKEDGINLYISDLEKANLCTPGMKPYVLEYLADEKKSYSVENEAKEKKEFKSKNELLKEILSQLSAAAKVNFSVNTKAGQVNDEKEISKEKDLEILKYAKDNKVTYGQAMIALREK